MVDGLNWLNGNRSDKSDFIVLHIFLELFVTLAVVP